MMSFPNHYSPSLEIESRRRSLRAGRRRKIIQSSKITSWLKDTPSIQIVPADPTPPSSPTDSVSAVPQPQENTQGDKSMKKRRRKTRKAKGGDASTLVPAESLDCSMVLDGRPTPLNPTPEEKSVAKSILNVQSPSTVSGNNKQEMFSQQRCADLNGQRKDLPSL